LFKWKTFVGLYPILEGDNVLPDMALNNMEQAHTLHLQDSIFLLEHQIQYRTQPQAQHHHELTLPIRPKRM
jgi:hypothetical protein